MQKDSNTTYRQTDWQADSISNTTIPLQLHLAHTTLEKVCCVPVNHYEAMVHSRGQVQEQYSYSIRYGGSAFGRNALRIFLLNTDTFQGCWVSGLCPLPIVLKEYDALENRSVCILRWKCQEGTYPVASPRQT
jgi:hypothetical protein